MILNLPSRLINNYLSKGLSIIEQNKTQLSFLPNDVKLRINMINQLDTYYTMVKKRAISAVTNNIKQMHIQKNVHIINKQDFYKNKEKEIYELFLEYIVTVMDDLDHHALIKEWKQNLDASAYEKNLYKDVKLPSIKKKIDRNDKT